MAAPTAPLPLAQQVKGGGSLVVQVPLRGLGAQPGFTDGGTAYNSGDPTATYTITLAAQGRQPREIQVIFDALDNLAGLPNSIVTVT